MVGIKEFNFKGDKNMSEECFITSEKSKAYIYDFGEECIIIKDIFTHESIVIDANEEMIELYKNLCEDGETLYVFYDKEKKTII